MKKGFDNDKYLQMQSEHIRERIAQFDNKLYLEFGGKLFDDYHASRVLPGFQPDSKLQMLLQLKDQAEVVIVINAAKAELTGKKLEKKLYQHHTGWIGNLKDVTKADLVDVKDMDPLDRYALDVAARTHQRVQDAYRDYEFHKVFHSLHNLCSTDLSAFYLDILKDRLYSSAPASRARRSAQTALYHILLMLVQEMAPVLPNAASWP